jgi:hypothetical protein
MLYLRVGFGVEREEYAMPWLRNAPGKRVEVTVHVLANGFLAASADATVAIRDEPPQLRFELTPDDGSPGEASIAGRVIGGAGVELALHCVTIEDNGLGFQTRMPLLTTRPALDGRFAFCGLPAGRYRIFAHAAGLEPKSLDVASPSGGNVIELGPAASFEFVVKDRGGARVKEARVFLQSLDGMRAWTTKADDRGVATVDGLPGGDLYALAVEPRELPESRESPSPREHMGREPVTSPLRAECFGASDRVTAKPGEREHVELSLLEPLPVRVHFERDDGTPVTAVSFQLRDEQGPALAGSRHFDLMNELRPSPDSRGDATLDLYPGHYVFRIADAALSPVLARDVELEVPRTCGAGTSESRTELRLPIPGPTGTLRGRLVDESSGRPIPRRDVHCAVMIDGAPTIQLEMTCADAEGRFVFEGIPEGVAELTIRADCHAGTSEGSVTVDDPSSPYAFATERVPIVASQVADVDVALPPVRGSKAAVATLPLDLDAFDAASGRALVGVEIGVFAVRASGERLAGTLHTDAAGHAHAELLAAERYRLRARRWADQTTQTPAYPTAEIEVEPKDGAVATRVALGPLTAPASPPDSTDSR